MTSEAQGQWAELLPGPAGTTAEASAALLRALPGDGFSPPAERVAAANALAGASVPVGRDADVERLLRAELEAFAAGYWGLSPSDRLTAWADLSRRGADAARLRELEPGLDVGAPALADPTAEALAGLVRTLFVLPARARAIRRNTWLREQAAHVEKWRAALAVVERDAPALAALEPQLRAALAPDFTLAAFVAGASAAPVSIPAMGTIEAAASGNRSSPPVTQSGSTGRGWFGFTIGGVPIFALIVIGKVLALLGGSSKTSNPTPAPLPPQTGYSAKLRESTRNVPNAADNSHSTPNTAALEELRARTERALAGSPSGAPKTTARAFTLSEIVDFKLYEQERSENRDSQEPPGYKEWLRAGRPPAAPTPRVVYIDGDTIRACQEYDQTRKGPEPEHYDLWLSVGRPVSPGTYSRKAPQ